MANLTLTHILAALDIAPAPAGADDIAVSGASVDSRAIQPGQMFVAMRGENTDGHAYVAKAFQTGASVALVQKAVEGAPALDLTSGAPLPAAVIAPVQLVVQDTLTALQRIAAWWRRQHDVTVVGITGSVGKTTAKEIVATVLSQRFPTLRNPGNHNNEIGLPLTLLSLGDEHRCIVLEMGMYALGEIALLAEIAAPQIGIVMNVEPVHLERLGTIDRIAQAKGELIEALPEDGLAVLYGDDPLVLSMASLTEGRIRLFGLENDSDVWAGDIEPQGLAGTQFVAQERIDDGTYAAHPLTVAMPGRHAVLPALAAVAVARHLSMGWDEIALGLEATDADLRLAPKDGINGSLILDDTYNASPKATLAAFELMRDLEGRRIAVLGDMLELGDYEDRAHREVGRAGAAFLDELITLGDRAQLISQAAIEAGMPQASVQAMETKDDVVALLRETLSDGDLVLVKGSRGMAMETIVEAISAEDAP